MAGVAFDQASFTSVPTRFTVTPEQYRRISLIALAALGLIVLTGAAVRLTGSGLGCSDWPQCEGGHVAPTTIHGAIEYGNRVFSALVAITAIGACVLAFRRRPFRRDLALISLVLPLGVLAQAALGAIIIEQGLAPGFVMAHFLISMGILAAGVALAWRAHHEPGSRPRSTDRRSVWAVRGLIPLGLLTITAGTLATAAGPHPGSTSSDHPVTRLDFKGVGTLDWMIHWHGRSATLLGVSAVAVWLLLRRRGADPQVRRAVTALCCFVAAQGVVGFAQYELELPAEIVWIHIGLATSTWLSILWATAAAGRLVPRAVGERSERLQPQAAR